MTLTTQTPPAWSGRPCPRPPGAPIWLRLRSSHESLRSGWRVWACPVPCGGHASLLTNKPATNANTQGAGCWGRGHTRHRRAAGNAGFPARPLHSFETHKPAPCPRRLWPQRAKLGGWGGAQSPGAAQTLSFSEEKTVLGWCIEKG